MMNIFAGEKIYGGWQNKGTINLKDAVPSEMYDAIEELVVTDSDQGYGKSVKFVMNGGAQVGYKPLSTYSDLNVGDKIEKSACFVTILSKPGEKDIYRITEKSGDK